MKTRNLISKCVLIVLAAGASAPARSDESSAARKTWTWEHVEVAGSLGLDVALATPATPGKRGQAVPVVLLVPGGPGSRALVEAGMDALAAEATARGWVVASPMAPESVTSPAATWPLLLPKVVDFVASRFTIEGGRPHLAGASNGGVGAIAAMQRDPARWASVLVFPGAVQDGETLDVKAFAGKPITLYAGEQDELGYFEGSRRLDAALTQAGIEHVFHALSGQGHALALSAAELVDDLERHRAQLHSARSRASGARP